MNKLPARNVTQDQTGLQASAVTVWSESTSVGFGRFSHKNRGFGSVFSWQFVNTCLQSKPQTAFHYYKQAYSIDTSSHYLLTDYNKQLTPWMTYSIKMR